MDRSCWTFDGALADCLADMEDALRRAIVQVGDVVVDRRPDRALASWRSSVASMPATRSSPAWSQFLERMIGPLRTALRHRACARWTTEGPLATLVIAYRS